MSVISATEIPYHIYEIFEYDKDKKSAAWLRAKSTYRNRRQDYPEKPIYFMDGAIYIHCCQSYKITRSLNGNMNFLMYLIPSERAIDIDSIRDIEKVERYLKIMSIENSKK